MIEVGDFVIYEPVPNLEFLRNETGKVTYIHKETIATVRFDIGTFYLPVNKLTHSLRKK